MNIFDRLFNRVVVRDNGCWEYLGGCDDKGYGKIWFDGSNHGAHRIAFMLCVDDIPADMKVLHKCDNPPCCNPDHLFIGTDKDNSDDKWAKGRGVINVGADTSQAKLYDDEVRQIKKLLAEGILNSRQIGDLFMVHKATIKDIKAGRTWKHIH